MKISFLTTDITSSAGTERVVVNLSNYFSTKNIQVEIISVSTKHGDAFYKLKKGIKISHWGLANYTNENFSSKLLKKIINSAVIPFKFRNIDSDFLIGTGKNVNIYMVLFARKKQNIIGCEHFAFNAPMSPFIRKIRNYAYRRLNKLVVLTSFDKNYYEQKGINVVKIPNALSFLPGTSSEQTNKFVIAVGRHTEQKQFDKLLEVWNIVKEKCTDWKLKIIGDGPLYNTNIDLAVRLGLQEDVFFLKPTKRIIDEYLSASIYAMTSAYEAFPMVILEAMACGLPCISFDCDTGPRDIINDKIDGILIPQNDVDRFANELIELIKDQPRMIELGKNARNNILRYQMEEIAPLWLELFQAKNN